MKTIKNFFLTLVVATCFTACEEDGDKIYLKSIEGSDLIASESSVVLTQQTGKQIVLSLAWTQDALTVSDPNVQAPNLTTMTLQAAASEDFSGTVTESVETSLSKAYTGADLNTVAKNLGATPDVANSLYFRLKSTVGNNMEPVFSNTVTVSVTPYTIDMSLGYILDAKEAETGLSLYSPDSNGEYTGFMGATAWYNYFLREGDGTVWGNDGVTGTPFLMSAEDTHWNCWFPGQGGCYYVDVNTNKKVWSALYIPSLTVSGDIEGEMTFDRPNVKWTLTFNAPQAGDITIRVAGTGKLYDYSTGTDDEAAIDTPVAFAGEKEALAFGSQPENITVTIPAAGECTLTLDLSNPKAWTAQVTNGSEEPVTVSPYIYLPGVDDAINEEKNWTFDNKLALYDEDNLNYAGIVNAGSQWGYQIAIEDGNWSDVYTLGEGDAYAGTLVFQSGTNLPVPEEGLYFFDISLKALTYQLVAIGNEIYYSGINDDWTLHALTATDTKGVFSGNITIEKASEWGFQIILDTAWTYKFGGTDGNLYYKGDNLTEDATLAPGSYALTVDLINKTYTIK